MSPQWFSLGYLMVQAESGLGIGSWAPLVSALPEGYAGPVSVCAGDVNITRSSLKLAGTKVTC